MALFNNPKIQKARKFYQERFVGQYEKGLAAKRRRKVQRLINEGDIDAREFIAAKERAKRSFSRRLGREEGRREFETVLPKERRMENPFSLSGLVRQRRRPPRGRLLSPI